jgi:PKHD-type hydroxylase
MLVTIPNILDQSTMGQIHQTLADGEFIDGRLGVEGRAAQVKRNTQFNEKTESEKALNSIFAAALEKNHAFHATALPRFIAPVIISRYSAGMEYGLHNDAPIMNQNKLRTDLAVTIFLNDPTDYKGGELSINSPYGEQRLKLPRGSAVVYPASTLHRVMPVEEGERIVAVTWVQSRIRDHWQRETLMDLVMLREKLSTLTPPLAETDLANKTYNNLLRMWSDG